MYICGVFVCACVYEVCFLFFLHRVAHSHFFIRLAENQQLKMLFSSYKKNFLKCLAHRRAYLSNVLARQPTKWRFVFRLPRYKIFI